MTPRLWSAGTVLAAVGLTSAGLAVGSAAWFAAATRGAPEGQIGAANLAVLGAVLLGTAATVWLALGRGAVTRRARHLSSRAWQVCRPPDGSLEEPTGPLGADDSLVAAAAMTRYHRSSCPLTHGRKVRAVSVAERAARKPCGVCNP